MPIIFVIAVGMIAYYYAAEGMSEKFQESAQQTANMAMQYMDVSCTYIQSEGLKYAVDSNLESYSIGMMKKDKVAQATYMNDTRVLRPRRQTLSLAIHILCQNQVFLLFLRLILAPIMMEYMTIIMRTCWLFLQTGEMRLSGWIPIHV